MVNRGTKLIRVRVAVADWLERTAAEEGRSVGLVVEGLLPKSSGVGLTPPVEGLKRGGRRGKKSEGSAPDPLHGIPEAVGVTEPLTTRPGGYMGIPREPVGPPKVGTDAWLSMLCGRKFCGHTRRVHLDMRKGQTVATGCALCAAGCRGFEEPA